MIKDNIDLVISEAQAAAMEGWLELLQQSMSELVSVSGPDSRRLFKMGAKSEAFVRSTLEAAGKHAALLPGGIRANMERDDALRKRLRPVMAKLQSLLSLVEGSYKLAGADLMKNGTAVYQILRLNGYQEGLEPLLEELGTRFARPKNKPTKRADVTRTAEGKGLPRAEAAERKLTEHSAPKSQPVDLVGQSATAELPLEGASEPDSAHQTYVIPLGAAARRESQIPGLTPNAPASLNELLTTLRPFPNTRLTVLVFAWMCSAAIRGGHAPEITPTSP